MKKKTRKTIPKKTDERTSLDKRIAKAPTFAEKRRIAMFNREKPRDEISGMAFDWWNVRRLRENPSDASPDKPGSVLSVDGEPVRILSARDEFTNACADVEKRTSNFVVAAMLSNRPAMLRALADAMESVDEEIARDWTPDGVRVCLINSAETGNPVNLSAMAREIVDASFANTPPPKTREARQRIEDTRAKRMASTLRGLRKIKKRIVGLP